MRTAITLMVAVSLFTMVPAASASHDETFEEDGEILAGQPGTGLGVGAAELGAACDTDSDLNGVDGQWHNITGFAEHEFELTMDDTLDVDVFFYDADCSWINADSTGAEGFVGQTEDGTVPANAAFAVVNGWAGTGSYTLTINA